MGHPTTVEGYPSEYFDLFRRALDEPLFLQCETKEEATTLGHKMNAWRRALHRHNHEFYHVAVEISVGKGPQPHILRLERKGHGLRKILDRSGINLDEAPAKPDIPDENRSDSVIGQYMDKGDDG